VLMPFFFTERKLYCKNLERCSAAFSPLLSSRGLLHVTVLTCTFSKSRIPKGKEKRDKNDTEKKIVSSKSHRGAGLYSVLRRKKMATERVQGDRTGGGREERIGKGEEVSGMTFRYASWQTKINLSRTP